MIRLWWHLLFFVYLFLISFIILGGILYHKTQNQPDLSLDDLYYCLCSELGFDATSTFNINLEFATACQSLLFNGCNITFNHYLCSKLPKRCPYLSSREFFMVELNSEPKMKSVYLMNDSQNFYRSLLHVFMPRNH